MKFFGDIFGEKDKSRPENMKDVLDILRLLEEAELNISEFYRLCSEAWKEDEDFWLAMSKSEVLHASYIRKMSELILKAPKRYKPGYSFSAALVRTFGMHITGLKERVKRREISQDDLLSITDEIENSAVELNYSKIVETDVDEYNRLAGQIDSESAEHKSSVAAMIARGQGRAQTR